MIYIRHQSDLKLIFVFLMHYVFLIKVLQLNLGRQIIAKAIFLNISKQMFQCLRNFLRNFVLRSDMFAAPATLRFSGQNCYQSLFGGILSIALVIAFAVIFYSSFVDVLTKIVITFTSDVETDPYNVHKISDMQFAVGIDGIDFGSSQRYFDLILTHVSIPKNGTATSTDVELEVCKLENWANVGDHFDTLFSVHEMQTMLCPVAGSHIQIQGFVGSDTWQYLQFKVEQCVNKTGVSWTCHPPATINSFVNSYQTANDYFKVEFYMTDTLFTPNNDIYIVKHLQDEIFLSFSSNTGSRGTVKIGDYNVTTDNSIWPVPDYTYEFGHYISTYNTHTVELFSTHYVKLRIQKDQKIAVLQRIHGKIDDMLSYVGGLFALLFAFIAFFIASYSEYSYQIAVAESAFTMDETGKKVRDKKFNFFTFLKYSIYDWLTTFNCSVAWHQMQMIHKAKEQAVQQMDVRLIIKKLQRLENINEILLSQRNLMCAQLTKPPTLERIKKLRKITQYYDKVIKESSQSNTSKIVPVQMNFQQSTDVMNKQMEILEEELSDFDSDDQEVQQDIINKFAQLEKEEEKNQYERKIFQKIPKNMKNRLKTMKTTLNKQSNAQFYYNSVNNTEAYLPDNDKEKRKTDFLVKSFHESQSQR